MKRLLSAFLLFVGLLIVSYYQWASYQSSESLSNHESTKPASNLDSIIAQKRGGLTLTGKPKIASANLIPTNNEVVAADDPYLSVASEDETNEQQSSEVSFEQNVLTVHAVEARLSGILAQISNQTQIPIAYDSVDPDAKVTLHLDNQAIDIVIKELLVDYDFFLQYGGRVGQLKTIWIFPPGSGDSIALVNSNQRQQVTEEDLYSEDPTSRILALRQIAASNSKKAADLIKDILNDQDGNVRAAALASAQEGSIAISASTLRDLVIKDESAAVRSMALTALSMNSELPRNEIAEIAEIALSDSEESIREEAEALLKGLEEASGT